MRDKIELDHSFSWTEIPKHVEVGRYSSIARDCCFHDINDNHYCVDNRKYVSSFNFKPARNRNNIIIGNDVWIGRQVSILSGVKIRDGVIVAAHSVVTKDIPPYAVVAGNPARIKRYRFNPEQIRKLLEIKWWDKTDEEVEEMKPYFEDIDKFIERYE